MPRERRSFFLSLSFIHPTANSISSLMHDNTITTITNLVSLLCIIVCVKQQELFIVALGNRCFIFIPFLKCFIKYIFYLYMASFLHWENYLARKIQVISCCYSISKFIILWKGPAQKSTIIKCKYKEYQLLVQRLLCVSRDFMMVAVKTTAFLCIILGIALLFFYYCEVLPIYTTLRM